MLGVDDLAQLLAIDQLLVDVHSHLVLEMRISHRIGAHNLGDGRAPVFFENITTLALIVFKIQPQTLTNCRSR